MATRAITSIQIKGTGTVYVSGPNQIRCPEGMSIMTDGCIVHVLTNHDSHLRARPLPYTEHRFDWPLCLNKIELTDLASFICKDCPQALSHELLDLTVREASDIEIKTNLPLGFLNIEQQGSSEIRYKGTVNRVKINMEGSGLIKGIHALEALCVHVQGSGTLEGSRSRSCVLEVSGPEDQLSFPVTLKE